MSHTSEHERLRAHRERRANWRHWGPYLSERGWGTVREDYGVSGESWNYFPHEHSRSRTYRWNEDGLGGISDRFQYLCFAIALWNGRDPILKERLFGLNPWEGNHGEDVKECYFYLENTPTHSYMKMLYKYPQKAFPYAELVAENQKRSSHDSEFELMDTGIFNDQRYFDVWIEYAKADQNDILIKISLTNRGPDSAPCHILPTLWFRNTWSWGYEKGPMNDIATKPILTAAQASPNSQIEIYHPEMVAYKFYAENSKGLLFTENETNFNLLYQTQNHSPYVKDAFHRFLINGEKNAINPEKRGTKAAAQFFFDIPPQETATIHLRLTDKQLNDPFHQFEKIMAERRKECDEFYAAVQNPELNEEQKLIQRQAIAGLLWSKQLYYYDMEQWSAGDPECPPVHRDIARNRGWIHLVNFDVISMPDKWEYPWYASWDLAFHCIPYALVDPDFAKRQLILVTREWYMHPNGQLPAYEWNFSDVNPPVHAWAAWRVYKIDAKQSGKADRPFLEAIFHKLLINFTWWVNQKDKDGNNVFQGGFLGLDNVSIFDRSVTLKRGHIDQADGTAWMGFYCLIMMKISLELSKEDLIYQDCATKFFEHFLRIASAMLGTREQGHSLWCKEDGFFYDVLHLDGEIIPLRIRSLVGLLPLFAVEIIDEDLINASPIYKSRMNWFLHERPHYSEAVSCLETPCEGKRQLLSILNRDRLVSTLRYMLDENEFLSEYGIRSFSKYHDKHPYTLEFENRNYSIQYQPGESFDREIAGGNSNWRGPIWFPINFLIIEALQKFHYYYGDTLKVEFPSHSGHMINLQEVAAELSKRLIALFEKNKQGLRPIYDEKNLLNRDPHWKDLILFNEFFHGDTGLGLGGSHQTGWTALVAKLLQQYRKE